MRIYNKRKEKVHQRSDNVMESNKKYKKKPNYSCILEQK